MTTQARPKKTSTKKKSGSTKVHTYLEKLVSRTKKFKVEDLLDLYQVYDDLVIEYAFRHLLFPYTRFSRVWMRDQVRDLLAGTDRNRLILTSRKRKASEEVFETSPQRHDWSPSVKPKYATFLVDLIRMMRSFDHHETAPTKDGLENLGVSRLVYDDMGLYYNSLMNSYPTMTADWMVAYAEGDHESMAEIDAFMRTLEAEVGIKRDYSFYVTVNMRAIYDQIEKMVQTVTMAYSRLLFRFAHRLRGITTTDENFSAGYEGMIRAARNYDPVDGSSFTAHCHWWVRSSVLYRQRQSSVIKLPSATWYQLSLLQRGQVDLSDERVSDLKERAEMFYANSSNVMRGQDLEDDSDSSFEAVLVTSPDAATIMGDSLARSQAVEETYEERDASAIGHGRIEEVMGILHEEDPSLLFPVLLWSLNSGIDATLLAETMSPFFVPDDTIKSEAIRHEQTRTDALAPQQFNK